MTVAIFSFLGIVTGAMLQYYFSRHLDSVRTHRDARVKAYTDYLLCVSELAHPDQVISSDRHEVFVRTSDAKCRICLYGSPEVITVLACFERLGPTLDSPEQQAVFVRMVAIMRRDSMSSSELAISDVRAILFGMDRAVT